MELSNFFKEFVGGAFFTVHFQKKDGTWRTLNGRLGVKKHLRGGERTIGDHLVGVWDCVARDYRCFDLSRVAWVKCWGVTVKLNGKTK